MPFLSVVVTIGIVVAFALFVGALFFAQRQAH